MPLYENDIRTIQAEDITQTDTAGRRMGTAELHNGQVGNVFGRLGREDRAAGAVDLVKLYLWGDASDATEAHNASTILTSRPADPRVSMVLFRPADPGTRSLHTDRRADAQAYVEAYLVPGAPLFAYVWGDHPAGSPELRLWSLPAFPAPVVGDVLYITGTGVYTGLPESDRYYQIIDAPTETREVNDVNSDKIIAVQVITAKINKPLAGALAGVPTTEGNPAATPAIKATTVADTAHFFGVQPIAAATAGDGLVVAASVYDTIVPTQTQESTLGNPLAVAQIQQTIVSGGRSIPVVGDAHSLAVAIDAANRATSYTRTLAPAPAAGTIRFHYRALGRWYLIQEGDTGAAGTITRVSGGVTTATLTRRPDADTSILFLWATPAHYQDIAGSTSLSPILRQGTLPSPAQPGSVSVAWVSGGTAKSATVSASGQVSGHATGYLIHATGAYWLAWSANLPDSGSDLVWSYTEKASETEVFTGLSPTGTDVAFTLAHTPVDGSLSLSWDTLRQTERIQGSDTASGASTASVGGTGYSWSSTARKIETGSTTRATMGYLAQADNSGNIGGLGGVLVDDEVTLTVLGTYDAKVYSESTRSWSSQTLTETFSGTVTARYQIASAPTVAQTFTEPVDSVSIDLDPLTHNPLYPGSVRITWGTHTYTDDGAGSLLWADSTVAGTINYLDGRVNPTLWSGASLTVAINSGLTRLGQPQQTEYAFVTAGSPIVPGELGITATNTDGTAINFMVPESGTIANAAATGYGRHDIGLVALTFADPVWPGSLRYTGTVRKTIPMDTALLGLDPTRLGDGQVPIYRVGDLVVVQEWVEVTFSDDTLSAGQVVALGATNLAQVYLFDGAGEVTSTLPSPLTSGQVITLGHTHLDYCLLRDARARNIPAALFSVALETGVITMASALSLAGFEEPLTARHLSHVDPDLWEVELATGNVTMATPLSLTGLTQPLKARYRIEDEVLVTDVQITGEIGLGQPLTHDYTAAAVVSSKLRHGDLQARVAPVWALNTWSGNWDATSPTPTGGGRYDDSAYPPLVTDHGAITERWRLNRRSDNQWDVIGESVGVLAVWNGSSLLTVTYQGRTALTLDYGGLGASGWSVGNQIRIDTWGCQGPFWALRCCRAGAAALAEDSATIAQRVDAD